MICDLQEVEVKRIAVFNLYLLLDADKDIYHSNDGD